jgi:hypothetical protein
MADIRQFSAESQQRIADAVRTVERSPILRPQPFVRTTSPTARELRWARTTTSLEFPSYPDSGNAVVVEFGDYAISGDPIVSSTNTPSFAAYDPEQKVVALMSAGTLPTQGSVVQCYRHEGQWWIEGTTEAASSEIWTQVVSATGVNTWWFWQYGAGARDTDDVQLTANGVYCFPRFGIGTYSNANGAVFALRTTPTAYNDTAITFSQKAYFALHITTIWRLPSLSSTVWNVNFKDNLTHDHNVTVPAGGTTYPTTNTTLEAVKRDSLRGVTVLTTVNGVNAGYSTIPYFYTAADGDAERYATHTRQLPIDRSSSQTGLTIVVKRLSETIDDLGSPVLIGMSLHMQQCSNILG